MEKRIINSLTPQNLIRLQINLYVLITEAGYVRAFNVPGYWRSFNVAGKFLDDLSTYHFCYCVINNIRKKAIDGRSNHYYWIIKRHKEKWKNEL